MAKRSAVSALGSALGATFKNLPTVIPLMLVLGLVSAGADAFLYERLAGDGAQDQATLVKVLLAWTGVALVQEIFLGPIVGAVAVYIGRLHSAGQTASPYQALNFALNRYKRLFLPRLIAQLSIQIGLMLLLFPGIIYVSMYAFVDSVACLEEKVWPLDRSKRLTRGRRGSIVGIYLPAALLVQVVAFAELWALQQGVFMLALVFATVFLLFFVVNVSFYKLYEGRTTVKKKKGDAAAGQDAAQQDVAADLEEEATEQA